MEPIVIAFIAVVVVVVVGDWIRNYLSKCPRCKGAGTLKSSFFSGQYRPCPRCKRKGEVRHGFAPKD
jgi:DnaJ-class molecular chaperone